MQRKYNISKKSDMRRLEKDLKQSIMQQAENTVMKRPYTFSCPHCNRKVSAPPGMSICPFCRKEINLKLDIH